VNGNREKIMGFADLMYIVSALLAVAGVVVYVAFRRDTVEEARGRITQGLTLLTSWPVRFLGYRSGQGRHTPKYVLKNAIA
jgi:hypothetical protein